MQATATAAAMPTAAPAPAPLFTDADGPHTVLLGPVACGACGTWVEWAGAGWLALYSTEPHDCAPFLAATQQARITRLGANPYREPRWVRSTGTVLVWALAALVAVLVLNQLVLWWH